MTALSLLGLLPAVLRTVGKIIGRPAEADAIAGTVERADIPPEKREELAAALASYEVQLRQLDVEALKAMISETTTMVQSGDKYVSRARPTGLYVAYAITVALAVGLIAGVDLDPTAILTILTPCWGASGYYMHLRSEDKRHGG